MFLCTKTTGPKITTQDEHPYTILFSLLYHFQEIITKMWSELKYEIKYDLHYKIAQKNIKPKIGTFVVLMFFQNPMVFRINFAALS